LVLALLVVAAMAGAGTWAYFRDTETSTGNTFAAGTLDLKLRGEGEPVAQTVHLNPDYGYDTSKSPAHVLTSGDLDALTSSDDERYQSGGWPGEFSDSQYLEFVFPSIMDSVSIESVVLWFEWQRTGVIEGAKLVFYNDDMILGERDLSPLPSGGVDRTEVIDLRNGFGIDTAAKVNALKVRFQAHDKDKPGHTTSHDWVELKVQYTAAGGPAWTDGGLTETLVVENIKPGDASGAPVAVGVKNAGSLGGTLKLRATDILDEEGDNPASETGDTDEPGELSRYLRLAASLGALPPASGTLDDLTAPVVLGTLEPGAEDEVNISWFLPPETGNDVQGDRVRFTIEFILEQ
jgi:predicted ribosomally synthesized peptide with SipW-like signal peptide